MAAPRNISFESEVLPTATADVLDHPRDLSRVYQDRFGVSRVTANRFIQRLEREGWISRSGTSTHPVYAPGFNRRVSAAVPLAGLEEDALWDRSFAGTVSAASNVRNIVHHGFTEMVNNAVDHSMGTHVFVHLLQSQTDISLNVSDDGIGIFRKITEALRLADPRLAMFELAKGKLTTDPARHSGEGVFFTSRMFDMFAIHANGLAFTHDDAAYANDWLVDFDKVTSGTNVYMRIALNSTRTASDVFRQYMDAPEDFGFNKTVVPMRLAQLGDEQLVSRSQAKRLIARFDRFKRVMLDFEGVSEIGQAFADEIFRVYAREHPEVELMPLNYTQQIEQMWLRAVGNEMGAAPDSDAT
jgi:anti-sigma regulatory factor (Ser/Thr protein kinase)